MGITDKFGLSNSNEIAKASPELLYQVATHRATIVGISVPYARNVLIYSDPTIANPEPQTYAPELNANATTEGEVQYSLANDPRSKDVAKGALVATYHQEVFGTEHQRQARDAVWNAYLNPGEK